MVDWASRIWFLVSPNCRPPLRPRARGNAGGRQPKLSPYQKREITEMLAAGRSAEDLARLFRVHRATIGRMVAKAVVKLPAVQDVDL